MTLRFLSCQICGGRHPTEVHAKGETPKPLEQPKPIEVEKSTLEGELAEKELQGIVVEAEQKGNELHTQVSGPIRKRKEHELILSTGRLPTKEKEEELVSRGLSIKTAALFNRGTSDESLVDIDHRIGEIYKKGERLIRKKFKDQASREIHRRRLDAAIVKLIARYHPEYLEKLKRPILEVRFIVLRKGGDVKFSLPSVLPTREEILEPLEDLGAFIDFSVIDWEELTKPEAAVELLTELSPEKTQSKAAEARERLGRLPSDLRMLALELGRAHKTGEWNEELVERFIKLMDRLPQYAHYRLGFLDLLLRAKAGEIEMPKKMLSVASGPMVEARAQKDLEALRQEFGIEPPEVFNVDLSQVMLVRGREAYAEKYGEAPPSAEVRALAQVLPFRNEVFDATECASLDAISNPKDIYLTLSEIVRVTRPSGIVRIIYRHRLPDIFFKALEQDLGLKFITKPHTSLTLPRNLYNDIAAKYGKSFADRLRQKIGKEEYILLQRTDQPIRKVTDFKNYDPKMKEGERAWQPIEAAKSAPTEVVSKAPLVEVVVEPQPDPKLLQRLDEIRSIIRRAAEKWERNRSAPAYYLRQRLTREIADSLRLESEEGIIIVQDRGHYRVAAGKEKQFEALRRESEFSPLYAGVKLLPRSERIGLLYTYAPRLASELTEDGVI